jgi:hypothetical protein
MNTMQKSLFTVGLATIFVAAALSTSFAAVSEAQARAICAKRAQSNASANHQQRYADACVTKMMASQKK